MMASPTTAYPPDASPDVPPVGPIPGEPEATSYRRATPDEEAAQARRTAVAVPLFVGGGYVQIPVLQLVGLVILGHSSLDRVLAMD